MSDLQIFELGVKLAQLLNGDKEAIADIKRLYERHPEMFKNADDVAVMIKEVVKEPEIITNAKRQGAILAAKKLQENRKMGEIAVENDNGTNIIFHTNKKNVKEFEKLQNKESRLLVEASSAKAAPTRLDRYASKSNDLPKCENTPSTTADENSNTKELQSQATGKEMKIKALKDKAKEFFKRKNQNKTNYERGFEK